MAEEIKELENCNCEKCLDTGKFINQLGMELQCEQCNITDYGHSIKLYSDSSGWLSIDGWESDHYIIYDDGKIAFDGFYAEKYSSYAHAVKTFHKLLEDERVELNKEYKFIDYQKELELNPDFMIANFSFIQNIYYDENKQHNQYFILHFGNTSHYDHSRESAIEKIMDSEELSRDQANLILDYVEDQAGMESA